MAKSERAKQLEAEQKAAARAAKLRRKTSDNPADWGRLRQIRETAKITAKSDPPSVWLMAGALALPIIICSLLAWLVGPALAWAPLGPLAGLLAALLTLTWRAKVGAYKRYEGQPGAAEFAISLLPKTWLKHPVITMTRSQDIVHRVVGPPGIILVGEGQPGRLRQLLASEQKKHESIQQGVPVTVFIVGRDSGQVPLDKLTARLRKLPKAIQDAQVTQLKSRLKALDAIRPKVPMPRGPLPSMKGARQGLRGH
ncbi:MAG: DUF4191 domain-containing protein [Propionibacteriaceae bacterium]|jgi:hypothetical protein|nr:DUF4191 domain-containing protein [Propionibacteriaceae bacterium]